MAVTTPIGSVRPTGAARTVRSAASRRAPPIRPAGTIARPGWPPVSRRAKIGATSPTKPIAPQIATQPPTPRALSATTQSRVRRMSQPMACADHAPAPWQLGTVSYLPLAADGMLLSRLEEGWGLLEWLYL